MTASGKTDESITFLATLAGIEDEVSVSDFIAGFNADGFCEFQDASGATFTIRDTNPDDDRYQYVDGCHIDILVNLDDGEAQDYLTLVKDNFNVKAISIAAGYFDITPTYDLCSIYVNQHKQQAEISMSYTVDDVGAIQQKMAEAIQSNWYDSENGKMGLSYGMIDYEVLFDTKGGSIYVTEFSGDMKTALSDYTAPAVSLSTLGFKYTKEDALCVYEDKEDGIQVAIHKPEWGDRDESWNVLLLTEINGYLLAVWYYTDDNKCTIQADKGSSSAKYDYFLDSQKYGNAYPDPDAVIAQFGAVFDMEGEAVLAQAFAVFEATLQARFGMGMDDLLALTPR